MGRVRAPSHSEEKQDQRDRVHDNGEDTRFHAEGARDPIRKAGQRRSEQPPNLQAAHRETEHASLHPVPAEVHAQGKGEAARAEPGEPENEGAETDVQRGPDPRGPPPSRVDQKAIRRPSGDELG
jgi:hypothetical protein